MEDVHEQLVHQTALGGRKEHVPDSGDRNQRSHVREKGHRPEKGARFDLLIQQDRQTQRHSQREGDRKGTVHDRVRECRHKPVIGKQIDKILYPDKLHRVVPIPLGKGHDEGQDDRSEGKDCESDEIRRDERIGHQGFSDPSFLRTPGYLGCHLFPVSARTALSKKGADVILQPPLVPMVPVTARGSPVRPRSSPRSLRRPWRSHS